MTLSEKQSAEMRALLEREHVTQKIVADIYQQQGSVYLVGGSVRDILLGQMPKDIDIEVHGISLEELAQLLGMYGVVIEAGKSFGVLRLEHSCIEWSVPRVDSAGRKPVVAIDASMTIEKALERRDLTINAMAIDVRTHNLIDPFGGYTDLKNRVLRSPNREKFVEDPLRFYRVLQFIGRFSATVDPSLERVCKTMDIRAIARERIEGEFEKLLLLSADPSRALRWLAQIGRVAEVLPELAATQGVVQSPQWHPEGDVFEHTMQAVDAAAAQTYNNTEEKLLLMYAALCHDLGKVSTTKEHKGRIVSYGHEIAGVTLAKSLLKRITEKTVVLERVPMLVRYHMMPGALVKQNASEAAYKRLAINVHPQITLRELSVLAYADHLGRNGESSKPLTGSVLAIDTFIARAKEYGVFDAPEEAVIQGRDLVALYGQGPKIGKLVRCAYKIQINKGIVDKERLLRFIAQEAKKL